MELSIVVKSLLSIRQFIEEDLNAHLAKLQLNAATSALSGINYAKDKKSVYWSVINHLEDLEQTIFSRIKSVRGDTAALKYIYISALKATIYTYLDEPGLVSKCCDDSVRVAKISLEYSNDISVLKVASGVLSIFNPMTWGKGFREEFRDELTNKARTFDAREFWISLIQRKEDFTVRIYHDDNSDVGVG